VEALSELSERVGYGYGGAYQSTKNKSTNQYEPPVKVCIG
jgi:hypothetical protein